MTYRFPEPVFVTRPLLPELGAYVERLQGIWDRRWLTNHGQEHETLAARLREHLRVSHLELFTNGALALFLGLRALDVRGEVITTPFTFPATPHALDWCNLVPVFADIDPVTMNVDPAAVEACITSRTSAILAVHVYGTPCDVVALEALGRKHSLKVIYDAAHAFGVEIGGRPIGTFGDLSMFSFHATKLFNTAEGGALVFSDPALGERLRLLRNFGIRDEHTVECSGINAKMSELQAALGLCVLEVMDAERAARSQLVATYRRRLANVRGISCQPDPVDVRSSYQYFVIRIDSALWPGGRDALHARLKLSNVITRKYFYPLCSTYDCYRHLPSAQPGRLPVAERVADEVLSLPLTSAIGEADVDIICDLILEAR
jgi:dTDP-4-amino-4,6-dideoxygalactose transaminase